MVIYLREKRDRVVIYLREKRGVTDRMVIYLILR